MEMPKTLLIGGTRFEVRVVESWPNSDEIDGECVFDSEVGNIIFIKSHLSTDAKWVTLIHESLHAMNSTVNHEFLDSLAQQFYAYLKLNSFIDFQ